MPLPLTFSTMQFRSAPMTYTTSPTFNNNMVHPVMGMGQRPAAVTLRPPGLAGQQIILYAEPSLATPQMPPRLIPITSSGILPTTAAGMKNSLRLVRQATSSGWTVVNPPVNSSGTVPLSVPMPKALPSPTRSRPVKRALPAAPPKAGVKRAKRKSRAADSSLTRSSTSSESFK